MKSLAGNNKFIKENNRALLLDLIRSQKEISKAGLAKITGLSPTAIGGITSSLLEEGYIHETGTIDSERGRRPIQLELKAGSYYSIGFDIDVEYLGIVLVDITGSVEYEKSKLINQEMSEEKIVSIMEEEIQSILDKFKIDRGRLLGIGISIAGMVDDASGEIILAPNLGWRNVNLKSYFKVFSDLRIYIENEAMSSAICENWIGCCVNVRDFVCINVKSGIGAGIFISGKLYKGAGGSAGEVGHIVVDDNGPKCGCGNYGCLETMSSIHYIVEKAKRLVRQGTVSKLNNISKVEDINIDSIIKAAREGDDTAKSILLESARYLGIAISEVVNILNPSKIVLGKEFIKYDDLVMGCIKEIVKAKALRAPSSNVEIVSSSIGEKSSMIGAAIIPLKYIFGR